MRRRRSDENHRHHCMVVHAWYPLGETRVEREALALTSQGIEVDIICLKHRDESRLEKVDGIWVHRLPVKRRRGHGFMVQLLEYLIFFALAGVHITRLHLEKKFDVIQVHNLPDFLVFTAFLPKLMGAKVILDLHDLMPEFFSERTQRPMDSLPVRLVRWQEWASCLFTDHVITVTDQWRQTLIGRGQPPDKITVVMNVADRAIFHKRDHEPARSKHSGFNLIYYGVLGYRHGLDIALEAIRLSVKKAPDISLLIIGAGDYKSTLQKMVRELGLDRHVFFSPKLFLPEELVQHIETTDAGIVPYRDGVFTGGLLPTKLMEFAALGFPTIAARTPTIRAYFDETMVEFFTPGHTEEFAECILHLYRDPSRRDELARNIIRFNERYNWEKMSADYVALVKWLGNSG